MFNINELLEAVAPFLNSGATPAQRALSAAQEAQPLAPNPLPSQEAPPRVPLEIRISNENQFRFGMDNRVVVPGQTNLRDVITSATVSGPLIPAEEVSPAIPRTEPGPTSSAETGRNPAGSEQSTEADSFASVGDSAREQKLAELRLVIAAQLQHFLERGLPSWQCSASKVVFFESAETILSYDLDLLRRGEAELDYFLAEIKGDPQKLASLYKEFRDFNPLPSKEELEAREAEKEGKGVVRRTRLAAS